ncbi:MAG: flagellar hook-associated protein FlgL [Rhodocyclaceae bacterium]|nr:flagellar hook-associated protein FlgL [Rhodocyclaceae bacterium]MBX3670686.1 flagellar hook-associated protein FlgL [Rhodocyclaceae bacterium]
MRISTSMLYNLGVNAMQSKSAELLHTQQQVASGRRVLTPSDDPVAASHALEVGQASAINAQYAINQQNATENLAMTEQQLSAASEVIQYVRSLAVQSGTPALNAADRRSIAADLRGRFDEMLGIANATDGRGNYLFGGYSSNGIPFSGSVEAGVTYNGDDGRRELQVAASRSLPVSAAGSDIFMRVVNGNGLFSTSASANNTGSASIDYGTVINADAWRATGNSGDYSIRFSQAGASPTYDIVDNASGISLLTGNPAAPGPYPRTYTPGASIPLSSQGAEPPFDLGASVIVSGNPSNGDSFRLLDGSSQSLFATLGNLITALEAPQTTAGAANSQLMNSVADALTGFDHALENVNRTRASVGAASNEVDALANSNSDLSIQYADTLSKLQDLDYSSALATLSQQQMVLEAAQKSFTKVASLSLFSFI